MLASIVIDSGHFEESQGKKRLNIPPIDEMIQINVLSIVSIDVFSANGKATTLNQEGLSKEFDRYCYLKEEHRFYSSRKI